MKIHYLGTCSGTEPMLDMHHQSWVLEVNGVNYWFDAGENCAHRAYTSGINVMNTVALFVSHPHMDHIGGLANLFSCMRKISRRYKIPMVKDNTLRIFFPDLELLQAIKTVTYSNKPHSFCFHMIENQLTDGLLFEDENVRVSALHNRHMKEDGTEGWHSYSFLIEAEGKRIVFSGDVLSQNELDPLIGDGCDVLITETGHHKVRDVLDFATSRNIRNLRFTHHGREIINDRLGCERIAAEAASNNPICIKLCYDGMVEEF